MSSLVQSVHIPGDDLEGHLALVSRIRHFPGRQWVNGYLDLAREIVEYTGIGNDDPRLTMSMPQGTSLPISINRRCILHSGGDGTVGLIMPTEYDLGEGKIIDRFFFGRCGREALWVEFSRAERVEFSGVVKEMWKLAVERELHRGRQSNFRRFHRPIVFEAAMNSAYREALLNEAF